MDRSRELEQIKKLYGEEFMHKCREFFPDILETEGLLLQILQSTFASNSRTLGYDIDLVEEKFKNYIYSKIDVEKNKPEIILGKSPYELLEKVGYDLYECISEEEIQQFKKYYKEREELCTFNGGRLNKCIVFWAVKKDAEKLKREEFTEPKREDEYGTSVMSIQFSKERSCRVSIKNRYNHAVNNPDCTYGNDLDRIVLGLRQSFADLLLERGLELDSTNIEKFSLPYYVVAGDGKFYKYNYEINGIYYCPGNIIIDHARNVIQLDSDKEILMDYFILDKEKKTLRLYDSSLQDSFVDGFKKIKLIEEKSDKEKGMKVIALMNENGEKSIIRLNAENEIVEYENENLTEIGDEFLSYNKKLKEINLLQLKRVGKRFLYYNEEMTRLNLPQVEVIGDYMLYNNKELCVLNLPRIEEIGKGFLNSNEIYRGLDVRYLKERSLIMINNKDIAELDKSVEITDEEINNIKEVLEKYSEKEKNADR